MSILNPDIQEIIFEGRNKNYGAYVLRKLYGKHVTIAFIAAVLATGLVVSYPYLKELFKGKEVVEEPPKKTVTVNDLKPPPPIDEAVKPPPPPKQLEPPKPVKQIKFVPPVVKKDEEVPEDEPDPIPDKSELDKKQIGTQNVEKGVDATDFDPPTQGDPGGMIGGTGDKPTNSNEVFNAVEQMPSFDGLAGFLQKNISYPGRANEEGIQGKVYVQFTVNTDGSITDVQVVKGIGYGCDEEAMRVIKKTSGRWKVGKQNGVPVRVRFTQPVSFVIQN